MNILNRIWKAKFHYILVLPALFLIIIFKVKPFFNELYLPFVDFQIVKGIRGSAWVGMDNFKAMFDDPGFRSALTNTLVIKIEYILGGGILAFILAIALSGIKSTKIRNGFSTLFLIPYFIPSVVVSYLALLLLSQNNNPFFELDEMLLANASLFQPLFVLIEVLKTSGIPLMIALAAIGAKQVLMSDLRYNTSLQGNGFSRMIIVPAARATAAFMLLQLSSLLTTDYELVNKLLNPLVYQTGETLDTYSFKKIFMMGDYNSAGAIWLFQFLIQLIFTLLAYYMIRGIFTEDLFAKHEETAPAVSDNKRNGFVGWIVTIVYSLIILVPIFLIFIYPFLAKSRSELNLGDLFSISKFVGYLLLNLAAVIVFMLITLTLSYPFTTRDLPGRGVYKIFLLIVLLMGGGSFHEYMLVKNLGMINTIFPQLIFGFFSIASVFVLKAIFNGKYSALKEKASAEGRGELHSFFYLYIPKIWKPLLALGCLQFVVLWNSYYPSFLYTSNPNQYSPIMQFNALTIGATGMGLDLSDPLILQYAAILTLPSILVLLLFRKWITSEVLISQIRRL